MKDTDKDTLIKVARKLYADGSDDNIEIDDNAETCEPGDPEIGTWVQAWVFVPKE